MALPTILSEQQFEQVPGVRSDTPSADVFGEGVARGIGQVGDVVSKIDQEMRRREEEKQANAAMMKVNQWSINAMHGYEDENGAHVPGFLEADGDGAKGVTRQYREKYTEQMEAATSGLNSRTKASVVNTLTRSAMADNERLADHEAVQLRKGTMASNLLVAQSFENRMLRDPLSDDESNFDMARNAVINALGATRKPGDIEKYENGLVSARITSLVNLGRSTPDANALAYFAKANEVAIKDPRLNEDDRAKLREHISVAEKSWKSSRDEEKRATQYQARLAHKAYTESVAAEAEDMTTKALIDPKSDIAKIIHTLNYDPKFDVMDADIKEKIQSQTTHLLTAQANRVKQPREFRQYSDSDAVKEINSILYVRQGDAGVAQRMIEQAAKDDKLSQADYLHFSGEAASKRSDQVNRALQTIIPKFWELDANRGVKSDSKNRFFYPMFPIVPGTKASKVGIGDRMGGGISVSRLGKSVEYARATPMELKRFVDDVKQYCMEHPEADTAAVAKALLTPVELNIASRNLLERLPSYINGLTPTKPTSSPAPTKKQGEK